MFYFRRRNGYPGAHEFRDKLHPLLHDVKTVSKDFPRSFPTEILEEIQPAFAVFDEHGENPNIGSVAYEKVGEEEEEQEHYLKLFRGVKRTCRIVKCKNKYELSNFKFFITLRMYCEVIYLRVICKKMKRTFFCDTIQETL